MDTIVMLSGLAIEGAAWWAVAFRRRDVWHTTVPALVVLGLLALVAGPPTWSPEVEPAWALASGRRRRRLLGWAFVFVMAVADLPAPLVAMCCDGRPVLASALVLGGAVVPGGGSQLLQADSPGRLRGAALAIKSSCLALYSEAPSANLAIIAGAVVGGCAFGAGSDGGVAALSRRSRHTSVDGVHDPRSRSCDAEISVNDSRTLCWRSRRGAFCHVAALTVGPRHADGVRGRGGGVPPRRLVGRCGAPTRSGGLVRAGDDAVAFTGTATTHGVLDPSTGRT
jgi:hypothetical protein